MNRNEVVGLVNILGAMYQPLLTGNQKLDTNIIDVWLINLKDYTFEQAKYAVANLGTKKIYGKVQPNDIVELLNPPMKNQNLGMEFVTRLLDLQQRLGTDTTSRVIKKDGKFYTVECESDSMLGDAIAKEFGEVGYSVYRQVKNELRELKTDDSNTFKAQVRNLFNSLKEREDHGTLEKLPYQNEAQKMINSNLKGIASTMKLNNEEN